MAIRCEHVHRLELRKSFTFWMLWQRSKCAESPHLLVNPVFFILDMHV